MTTALIKVSAAPNPAIDRFTLSIRSGSDKQVELRVMNILGSVVEQRLNITPNSTLVMGQSYKAGVYFVEVRRGEERQILRLMKQR